MASVIFLMLPLSVLFVFGLMALAFADVAFREVRVASSSFGGGASRGGGAWPSPHWQRGNGGGRAPTSASALQFGDEREVGTVPFQSNPMLNTLAFNDQVRCHVCVGVFGFHVCSSLLRKWRVVTTTVLTRYVLRSVYFTRRGFLVCYPAATTHAGQSTERPGAGADADGLFGQPSESPWTDSERWQWRRTKRRQ